MEARLVPQAGLPLEMIRVAGLKGIGGVKLLRNLAMLPAGLLDSEKIIRRHRNFGAAFGVGGYASGPMMLAAVMHRIPTVVFEPNVEPGFTNRSSGGTGHARRRGHEETAARFGSKAVVTGCRSARNSSPCAAQRAPRAFHAADHRRQPRRFADQSRGD